MAVHAHRGSALLLSLLLAAVSAAAPPPVLERGNGPEPDSLDPARAQGLSAHQVLRDLYEGLVSEDPLGTLVGGAALAWRQRDDGRTWTFVLRPGLRFSDGAALRAQDFAASLARALDPQTAAPYGSLLLPIAGAAARLRGEANAALGVRALDDTTLEIALDLPCPDLPARLSLPLAMPVRLPPGSDATTGGRALLGNGAYRLADWQPGAWIELEANPHWREADQLAIRRVRFHVSDDAAQEARRFAGGELHLTETIPPQPLATLRARFGTALRIAPAYGTFFLGLNLDRPPFAGNPALREALGLAIDRDLLVRLVTGAGEQPAWTLVPPTTAFAAPSRATAIARARQLYAQAGYGADRPLAVELRFNSSSQNRRLMLAIAAMWREHLGVRTRLRNEEWKVFVRNRRARVLTQVFRGGWNADLADPLNFLETFTAASPLNATGFADPEFDALLAASQQAGDEHRRRALLDRAEQRLLAAHPIIPLYHYASRHLVDPRLEGFEAHPLDHHPTRFLRWRAGAFE